MSFDAITRTLETKGDLLLSSEPIIMVPINSMVTTKQEEPEKRDDDDIQKTLEKNKIEDYEFVRQNFKSMIEDGMIAIPGAISCATESESPKAYEAMAALLKTMADLNRDLMNIHGRMETKPTLKERRSQELAAPQPNTTNNNIFLGTSEDLNALIKSKMDGFSKSVNEVNTIIENEGEENDKQP